MTASSLDTCLAFLADFGVILHPEQVRRMAECLARPGEDETPVGVYHRREVRLRSQAKRGRRKKARRL